MKMTTRGYVKPLLTGTLISAISVFGLTAPSLGSTELSYTLATADIEIRNSGSVISDANGEIEL